MRRRRNPDFGELPYDVPIPAAAVMFNSDGSVTLETAGEAPVINRGRRRNQYHEPHAKREAMLRELSGHLADLVEAGEMSDQEANDWYNMKADQWAQGLNPGRRSNEKPGLVELINVYNESSDPGAYRSDEEHAIERERAREALRAIRRHYVEGVDYKEFSNGMLWPISRNRGRRRNASSVVSEIRQQLIASGLNPRLDYVEWDANTLKVSKGQNGALIHYDRGRDLYDITEYHGFKQKHLGSGYQAEELYDAVMPTLTPRHRF